MQSIIFNYHRNRSHHGSKDSLLIDRLGVTGGEARLVDEASATVKKTTRDADNKSESGVSATGASASTTAGASGATGGRRASGAGESGGGAGSVNRRASGEFSEIKLVKDIESIFNLMGNNDLLDPSKQSFKPTVREEWESAFRGQADGAAGAEGGEAGAGAGAGELGKSTGSGKNSKAAAGNAKSGGGGKSGKAPVKQDVTQGLVVMHHDQNQLKCNVDSHNFMYSFSY